MLATITQIPNPGNREACPGERAYSQREPEPLEVAGNYRGMSGQRYGTGARR